jgi:hypothetical protein
MLILTNKANKIYLEDTAILKMEQVASRTLARAVILQQDISALLLTELSLHRQPIAWQAITKHVSKITDFSAIIQTSTHGAILTMEATHAQPWMAFFATNLFQDGISL